MTQEAWAVFREKDKILRSLLDGIAFATKPDVIADIGCFNANEIARFHSICPEAACHGFEANGRNIEKYISIRNDIDGVIINNFAVADYDGDIEFNVLVADGEEDDWRRGAGSLNERNDEHGSTKIKVPCIMLDTYFAQELENKARFLLWIDVEGALDRVLAGGSKVLSRTIALRAEVERHQFWVGQKLAGEMYELFDAAGFNIIADSYTPGAYQQSDALMLNKNWVNLAAGDE